MDDKVREDRVLLQACGASAVCSKVSHMPLAEPYTRARAELVHVRSPKTCHNAHNDDRADAC